jgi:carbonic anhydrase
VLGARLGEAIVARNVGGRVTPALIKDLAWIVHLHENKTPDTDWLEMAVIHHTDCGSGLHDLGTAKISAVVQPA